MRIKILLFFFLLLSSSVIYSQDYNSGELLAGIRVGGGTGISIKKFSSPSFAIEGVVGWGFYQDQDGPFLNLLFEKHVPLSGNKLTALIGAGPTIIFGDRTAFGIAGVVGFDWRLGKSPINLQLDWMPAWYLIDKGFFSAQNGALTVRYMLNYRKIYPKQN